MKTPDGWELIDGRLMAEYEFEDFALAKEFIDAIAVLSEQENHHPEHVVASRVQAKLLM